VRLTAQNAELHQALKKAKEHILAQEKLIQAQNAEASTSEKDEQLLSSLRTTVKEMEARIERLNQELVDTRAAARREQRLMTSAVT
jgi:protein HOOK3